MEANVDIRPKTRIIKGHRHKMLKSFALIAGVLPLFCSSALADEFSQSSHYAVRMFSVGTLTIEARVGDIHIEGWDEPRVEVEAEKVVQAKSEGAAKPLYGQVTIVLEGKDKDVRLRTVYPPRRPWRLFRGETKRSVNFHIKMPYDAKLRLKCVDGDVRIRGLTSQEQVRVNYGDVEIDVPSVHDLRSFDAHAFLGYVQSDLHGLDSDSAGFQQRIWFWNSEGKQDVYVRVRMGGIFVYSDIE